MGIYVYGQANTVCRTKAYSDNIKRIFNEGYLTWKMEDSHSYLDYGEPVGYIQGTGNQYIFTDYLPNTDTDITAEIYPETEYSKMVFGQRLAVNTYDGLVFYTNSNSDYYSAFDSFNDRRSYKNTSLPLNEYATIKLNKDSLVINDEIQDSSYFGDYTNVPEANLNKLALFTIRTIGDAIDNRIFKGRFRKFQIKENGITVMNLQPIHLTKQSYGKYPKGSYIMWDTVSNTVPEHFGTFLGPTEEPYIRTEYSRATGAQYTDLNIKNNSNLVTRGRIRANKGISETFVYGSREEYLVDTNALFTNSGTNAIFFGMGANWKMYSGIVNTTDWVEFYQDKYKTIINGKEYSNTTPVTFGESDLNLFICACNQRAGLDHRTFYGDIDYFQIETEDGTKLLDLESCIETKTGIAGFKDNITNTFIVSGTNTEYQAGPIVIPSNWNYPSEIGMTDTGGFQITYEGDLNPDWVYNDETKNVILDYTDENNEPLIYKDRYGNIIIKEEEIVNGE